MPLDRPILVAGISSAPASYEVSGAEEIILLAVNAIFDGSGAASAYVPAVEILSDGGIMVSRVIAQTEVAAGGSAEASFAPGLVGSSSLTEASTPTAIVASALGDTQLVAAVASHRIAVMQVALMASGFVDVKFKGAGDLTGAFPLAANTGFVLGPSPEGRPWFVTALGSALSINLSSATPVGGVCVVEIV